MADPSFRVQLCDPQTVGAGALTGTRLASAAYKTNKGLVATALTLGRFHRALIALKVTAVAAAAGDTLDVWLQKDVGLPGSPTWTDFVHFTQVLGNGGAITHVAEITNDGTNPTDPMHAVKDKTLAVGTNHGPWSDDWRISWTGVNGGGTLAMTFEVDGSFYP